MGFVPSGGSVAPDPISHRQHFVTLDGLRGVAAICVMLFHINTVFGGRRLFPSSYLAVDFFFILSGFVVGHSYDRKLVSGAMKFPDFALRRITRLYPLIILGALMGGAYWYLSGQISGRRDAVFAILAILCMPWFGTSPTGGGIAPINSPAWSLFFELLANAVYGAVAKLLNRWVLAAILLGSGMAFIYLGAKAHFIGYLGVYSNTFLGGCARVTFSFFVGVSLCRWRPSIANKIPSVPGWILALLLVLTFLPPQFFRPRRNLPGCLCFPPVSDYRPTGNCEF